MYLGAVTLTGSEQSLFVQIDFDLSGPHNHDRTRKIGAAACQLTKSLLARGAIPDSRLKYFTDPDYNVGGRGKSHADIFEHNGTYGDAILSHPHFLKFLRYFILGPDLPERTVEAFRMRVEECGTVTSGDLPLLWEFAKQQARAISARPSETAEEFYKLALDCDLDCGEARFIRDEVKRVR